MFEIDEVLIKRNFGDIIYNKGLDLYLRNKVRQIEADINDKDEDKDRLLLIDATVESAFETENHKVKLSISQNTGTINYKCSCGIAGERPCQHIVAVMLKWTREKNSILKNDKSVTAAATDRFVDYIKFMMNGSSIIEKDARLDIKYEFASKEYLSSIEIKVGEDKTYVVKNIREFLGAVRGKLQEIEFGKNFTFNPQVHIFNEKDSMVIELLKELFEIDAKISINQEFEFGRSKSALNKLFNGKKAYLTDSQVKRLFAIIKDKYIDIVIDGESFSNVLIKEEDMPLNLNLNSEEDSIILRLEGSIPIPLTFDREYFFYKGEIYKPSKEQVRFFSPYYSEFISNKSRIMRLNNIENEKIASYIIPSLKKVSKGLNLDDKLEQEFFEENLVIQLYLDKEDEAVTADVIFKYGDLEINPFNNRENRYNDRVLIRDKIRENNIIMLLKDYGFKEHRYRYIIENQELIAEFLTEGLLKLQQLGEVYYSEAFKGIKVYNYSNFKTNIKLNDQDLLEFSFSIEGVDREELKNIFNALRQKKKYYKLKKGGFVSLNDREIETMGNLIEYLDIKDSDLDKESILVPKYHSLYIDESLNASNIGFIERSKRFKDLVKSIREIKDVEYKVPDHLENVMREYQKFGYRWLKTLAELGFGGILADEMGLGKTLQAIALVECSTEYDKKPSLVIAPTSLIYNWSSEVEKFAPALKTMVICGSKDEREEKIKTIEEADIIITSYPLIRRDIEEYKKIEFKYCFLDEAQQIKNPASQNAQSVKEIKAKGYFALTGTPIENSLTELWSIFDFIMPGFLLSYSKFTRKYETPIIKDKEHNVLKELNKHTRPFILRRLKQDVISELPPKIEHKLLIEMTEEQKKLYASYIAAARDEINEEIQLKGFNKSKFKILSVLTRLRQICCDPTIFVDNFEGDSGKMLALDELLEESITEGHRILLFSQFTSVLKNIAKRLDKSSIEYLYLDGQTKVEERGKLVSDFNEGKGKVFLISLKAGGTGLNLTGADLVIHFDPWWNPAVENQATDRAHRIGQKKTVEVIKLIARGTIEEKIYELQEKKKDIFDRVLDRDNEQGVLISQMSQGEIEDLFRI